MSISYSTSCPCLVERAMMPPSIVSEAYNASLDPDMPPSPATPVIEPPPPPTNYPSLVTAKHDLHDEIVRIFSNAAKPTFPPFALPRLVCPYTLWESPDSRRSSSSSFQSFSSVSGPDSATNSRRSRRSSYSRSPSSLQSGSLDSFLFSPSMTRAPAGDRHRSRASSSATSSSLAGLGLSGVYNPNGTHFDGLGMLPRVRRSSYDSYYYDDEVPPFHSGPGSSLYEEERDRWNWTGGDESMVFDADTTLVDPRGTTPHDSASVFRLGNSSGQLTPPSFLEDTGDSTLTTFSDYFARSTTHAVSLSSSRGTSFVTNKRRLRAKKGAPPAPPSIKTSKRTPNKLVDAKTITSTFSRKKRTQLPETLPLLPPTSDVFYSAPPLMSAPIITSRTIERPVVLLAPAEIKAQTKSLISSFFQLRSGDEITPVWTLPKEAGGRNGWLFL